MAMLDLVALATVADVAPLDRRQPGLRAAGFAGDGAPGSGWVGSIGRCGTHGHGAQRLPSGVHARAAGECRRTDRCKADLGARLLATDDPHEAAALAERLDQLNTERREIEASVRAAALAQAEERGFENALVWAAGAGWHPGIVGIVAARLKEASNRPAS